ncbi:MAG: hypothetical protein ACXWLZ_06895 [Rhizomicrobium sp.]
MTKKSATPRVPKNKISKRTSMWLANDLRAQLDRRAKADRRSLAQTIDFYLRKGLGKPTKGEADAAPAPIFG